MRPGKPGGCATVGPNRLCRASRLLEHVSQLDLGHRHARDRARVHRGGCSELRPVRTRRQGRPGLPHVLPPAPGRFKSGLLNRGPLQGPNCHRIRQRWWGRHVGELGRLRRRWGCRGRVRRRPGHARRRLGQSGGRGPGLGGYGRVCRRGGLCRPRAERAGGRERRCKWDGRCARLAWEAALVRRVTGSVAGHVGYEPPLPLCLRSAQKKKKNHARPGRAEAEGTTGAGEIPRRDPNQKLQVEVC
mmetsp:Transcript_72937/g.207840  ORF Transcript_72937/g.207840 Transcript_72937/m.207840 type:complete len:245 (-) Transcript_72937:208-942(-)